MITYDDFEKVDIRVGKIISVEEFPEGRYSTHILNIDFGEEIGMKVSLARLKPNYTCESLLNRQIIGVVNFPPKQIGKYYSEVLTLGFADASGNCVLIHPDREVPLGNKMY